MSELPKTPKQLEAEAKKALKLAKFNAKQSKLQNEPKPIKKEKSVASIVQKPVEFVNVTPKGMKKDVSGEFPPTFQPKAVEAAWYDWWESEGFFKPELTKDGKIKEQGSYIIPIPPPNVTGTLHLGHALTNSIQDVMIRWNRMKGKTVLWLPGADHAGIATQIVVEKKLMRERGLTRHQIGREQFINETYQWKDQYIGKIYNQIRRLGSSVDWDRARFTMDPDMVEAVNEAFVRMHNDGTIYRANRLVNWCTKLKTALSNLEVESMELEGSTFLSVPDHDPKKKYEFGVMISFAYQVEGSDEKIVVATTRLETMLGDTGIAVNPNDERYKHLHGKFVTHPFQNRRIPIVADEYADASFGTGAVKITPAHDQNDFLVGKRQKLEFINIFTDDGKINENGYPFVGQQRFDCRVSVLEALKAKGLYVDTVANKMVLPICGRSNNIIEPLLKPQWWVNCDEMSAAAIKVVEDGEIKILPAQSEREWYRWLNSPQDWCISRQLWWGHRVPAYYVLIEGDANDRTLESRWVSARSSEEAMEIAKVKFKGQLVTLEQDEDVLDTWFSSGLWPFSTLGWPKKSSDLELFFPNTLLETGCDILFFWVARMVMMSLKLTGKVPFTQVFCHAMVRDAHGRKMSKSLGNVIDPLDVIEGITLDSLQERLELGNLDPKELVKAKEGQLKDYPDGIPECGTDALRFTLLSYMAFGRDINLDILRVDGYKKYCNKIWNATRFANLKLGPDFVPRASMQPYGDESLADLWILHRLNVAIKDVNEYLEQMNFMQATSVVYQFWWTDLCDVYLEVCKPVLDGSNEASQATSKNVLYTCLDQALKLLHPFMPFVTEDLFQRLPRRSPDERCSIMVADFPVCIKEWDNSEKARQFEFVNAVVHAARSLLSDYNLKANATLYIQSATQTDILKQQCEVARNLIRGVHVLTILEPTDEAPLGCSLAAIDDTKIFLLIKGHVDIDQEIQKLIKKKEKVLDACDALVKKQCVDGYALNVKQEIKDLDDGKVGGYRKEIEALELAIVNFGKLLL